MNASGPPLSPSAHPADCECSICQLRASCRPVATTSRTRSTGSTGNLVGQRRRNLQAQQVHHSYFKERYPHLTPTLRPRNRSCASRSGTNNGGEDCIYDCVYLASHNRAAEQVRLLSLRTLKKWGLEGYQNNELCENN